jgi:hypothetical protein
MGSQLVRLSPETGTPTDFAESIDGSCVGVKRLNYLRKLPGKFEQLYLKGRRKPPKLNKSFDLTSRIAL